MALTQVIHSWVGQLDGLGDLSEFFVRNVSPDYISHGEIVTGRSRDGISWVPNLREILLEELTECVKSFQIGGALRAAVATQDGNVLALAIVQFVRSRSNPFAWIDDLIVDEAARSHGIGRGILKWIEDEIRSQGIRLVFLESGIKNEGAHHFFESRGYLTCSKVMKKNL